MTTRSDLYIDQGSDFSVIVSLRNQDATPIDLTGFTVKSQFRKSYQSSVATDFTVSVIEPLLGKIRIKLPADTSSALIVDAISKIDAINVGNLTLTGNSNTLSSTDTNGNILLDPNGTGYVQVVETNAIVIPSGTSAQQGPAISGAIRYNTTTSQFEGFAAANWQSLGGVRSVDGLTYIIAESSPGSSDDTLHFYAATGASTNIQAATLDQFKLAILPTTASTSSTTLCIYGAFVDMSQDSVKQGPAVSNDTTTATNYCPMWTTLTSSTPTTIYVSSTKLYFNPSTGTLNSTVFNSLSDENAKTNIVHIENTTDKVTKLVGVEFDWNDTGKKIFWCYSSAVRKNSSTSSRRK